MVTVNRTVLCNRLYLTVVWLVAKNIVVGRILTHSLVQNYLIVILMYIVQRIAMLL